MLIFLLCCYLLIRYCYSGGENIQAVVGEDGCIRSTGPTILAADDKAGIAAILEVLDVLAEENQPRPPLEIL